MTCGQSCRYAGLGHSDAAKRISDAVNLAWTAHGWDGFVGHWMAFTLAQGLTDHVLYPTKHAAITHVSDEFRHLYLKMHPMGMPVCEAEIMLTFYRQAYDNGFRLADPDHKDGGREIIPRIGTSEIKNQIRLLRKR